MTSSARTRTNSASSGSRYKFSSVGIQPSNSPAKKFDFSIAALIGHKSSPPSSPSPSQSQSPSTAAAAAAVAAVARAAAAGRKRSPIREPAPEQQMACCGDPMMAAPGPPGPPRSAAPADAGQQRARKLRPKNFQCSACKMAFSNNGQLRNHVRIHTGERPFRCKYQDCNKTFTRNEELTRHKLIHSGQRPHACGTCGKRFGRKDHLKKHTKTHENKRNRQLRRRGPFVDPVTGRLTPPALTLSINCDGVITATGTSATHVPTGPPTPADILAQQAARLDAVQQPSEQSNFRPTTQYGIPFEQLANEYWNGWYNLFGFYPAGQYGDYTQTALPTLYHNVVDDNGDDTRRQPR